MPIVAVANCTDDRGRDVLHATTIVGCSLRDRELRRLGTDRAFAVMEILSKVCQGTGAEGMGCGGGVHGIC